jgi:hypothetical protein
MEDTVVILDKHFEKLNKRPFDPSNKADLATFKEFLETGRWGLNGCPFLLTWPYLTVPDMIKDKVTKHVLKVSA